MAIIKSDPPGSRATRLFLVDIPSNTTSTLWRLTPTFGSVFVIRTTIIGSSSGNVLASSLDTLDIWLPPSETYTVQTKHGLSGATAQIDRVFRNEFEGAVVDDSKLSENAPTTNFESQGLQVGVSDASVTTYRSVLHFDLLDLPANLTITSAILSMNVTEVSGVSEPSKARRLTQQGWVAGQVTWNNFTIGLAWSAAGGDFTNTSEVDFNSPSSTGVQNVVTGLNALVQDAVSNRNEQFDLIIMRETEIYNGFFSARDSEWATNNERPSLTISGTALNGWSELTSFTSRGPLNSFEKYQALSGLGGVDNVIT